MKHQIQLFFTALMFYTRIPCPSWVNHDADLLNKSTIYFPVIGVIVGMISYAATYFMLPFYSLQVSIIIGMIASILTTGAFHEDGFADVCDGFGGGWSKQKILDIMKDSRVGAYGVIGLIVILLLKFFLLQQFSVVNLFWALLLGHICSRASVTTIIYFFSYSQDDAISKAKPIAKGLSFMQMIIVLLFCFLPVIAYIAITKHFLILIIVILLFIASYGLGLYYKKWIDGYTGDCLGATQQINEIVFYMLFSFLQ